MKLPLTIIFGIIIEILLFIVIFLLLLLGLLGVFLPAVPGLVLVGIAAGIYSLMVKSRFAQMTPRFHRYVVAARQRIENNIHYQKGMAFVKKIKKKYEERVRLSIIKYGLILLGFNVATTLVIIFSFVVWHLLATAAGLTGTGLLIGPATLLFVFASMSAIIWFRMGQVIGNHFKIHRVSRGFYATLISVVPMLLITLIVTELLTYYNVEGYEFRYAVIYSVYCISVLASFFQFFLVYLGMVAKK